MYAALGLGLVLVHRASGVVNFAHGAMAMLVTYAFVELRPHAGLWPALAVSVVAAAVLGLVVYGVVFRPLRRAPALARVVASVGLLATLQALAVLWFGADSRPVPSLLPDRPVSVLGTEVPVDRLVLAALVVVMGAGLWALYRFTRFGLASRATAEDEVAVAMLGWSPDVVSALNWVLAAVLAGLGGILVGPLTALDPETTTLLVVPALAAALAGRLSSFGATVAAALGLGMAQSGILRLQDVSWIPRSGMREALPLVVIVVALALGAGAHLGRGAPVERPLPLATRPRRPFRWTVVGLAGGAAAVLLLGGQYRLGLVNSLIGAVVCLSLVVLTGYVGQISLAQMAFAGAAGFSLAKLTSAWDVPFPLAPLLAAALATVVGVLVGLPALRLRGLSLAVVTLAAAVAVEEAVFKAPALTGGFEGTRVPELPGGVGRAGTTGFGLVALGVLAAVALGVTALRRGRLGRRFLAVRANERAAAACGIGLTATKLTAFALSAFVAGVGGALLGYGQGRLSFGSFGVFVSLSYLAAAYLGGIGSVAGALLGGLLVPSGLAFTVIDGRYQLLVSGIGLIAVAVLRPQGLVGRRR